MLPGGGIAERWVESLHAATKKDLSRAPNAGCVHVAFTRMQIPLRDRLDADAEFLDRLADACQDTHTAMQCIRTQGLHYHPSVAALAERVGRQQWLLNRKHEKNLIPILYHVDGYSCHAPLPPGPTWKHLLVVRVQSMSVSFCFVAIRF